MKNIVSFIINLLFPSGCVSATFTQDGKRYEMRQLGSEKYGDTFIVRFHIVGLEEKE